MKFQLPPVYPITNSEITGLPASEQVCRLAAGGATFVQIREKRLSSLAFYQAALEALETARELNIKVVINDRVDIALLCGADGVHLGQEDISPEHARRLLGEGPIIGYSTHTIDQLKAAVQLPIDYVAFGPIFSTSTKERADPVVGLEMLAEARSLAGTLPVVAIGGINETNIASVIGEERAHSAAVINAVLTDPGRISDNYRRLTELADR